MPRIPQYDSQATLRTEKLTEEAPAIRIPAGSFSAPTQALGEMGQAIGKIGENIYTLQAQEESSKANIQAHQGRLEIENTQDAETQGWLERRNKEIQDLRANTLKGMRNPLAKREFEAEFDNDIIDTQFRLKKAYVSLTVDKVKTVLYQERETAEQEIFSGINDERKQARIDKIGKRYSQLARLGGMKPDVALKEFREWQVELKEGKVKWDIYKDTATQEENSTVLKELRNGKKGDYPDLPQEQRLKLIEESQRRIFQNNQTFKRDIEKSSDIRHNALLDKFAAGTLTLRDIENEMLIPAEQGGVPKKILVKYQGGLQSDITKDLLYMIKEKGFDKKPTERNIMVKKYLGLIDKFIDDKVDLWTAREALADAYADGITNSQEAKFLNELKQNLEHIEWNRKSGFIKWVIGGVKERLRVKGNLSDEEIALEIKHLLDNIQKTDNSTEAILGVVKKLSADLIARKFPDIATYPKEGQLKVDAYGNKIFVYPDGTYKETE